MTQADLQAVRNPSLLLVIVLIMAAGAIYYTNQQVVQAQTTLAAQVVNMEKERDKLRDSGTEKEIMVRYLGAYQQLQRSGFVGEERINWLDGLRLTNQQADLFGVDYEIGAQKPYPYLLDLDSNPGQVQLNQSVMKLRFRLLHEADLPRFLTILAGQGAGLYTVDQCSMKRLATGGAIRYQPNIAAECELAWITAEIGKPPAQKKP